MKARAIAASLASMALVLGCASMDRGSTSSAPGTTSAGPSYPTSASPPGGYSSPTPPPRTGAAGTADQPGGTSDPQRIAWAQKALQAAGFNPGSTSGAPTQQTVDALRSFQQSKGLPATGVLNQQTEQALATATGMMAPGAAMP